MNTNIINNVPYLKTSRRFPYDDPKEMALEVNISYVEIANAVNVRTIGIFPQNRSSITGESWYITNQKQQGFRQIYTFTTTAAINHGINIVDINRVVRGFGTYTDGTNWYGLIYGSSVAIAGQRSFYVTPTQIIFVNGAGAPTLNSGTIVLEWISDV